MTYLVVVLMVGLLISLHEFGHLVAAKLCRIPVARFSLGFGPKVLGLKLRDTSYWISAVPIGGYVLPSCSEAEWQAIPIRYRILFALGGPCANAVAGFVSLLVFDLATTKTGFLVSLQTTASRFIQITEELLIALLALVAAPEGVSGIIGVVEIGAVHFGSTIEGLLMFAAILNLNLLVLNLLPIPPLDGARVAFCILERIHPVTLQLQRPAMVLGWGFILIVMLYATVQDLSRFGDGMAL